MIFKVEFTRGQMEQIPRETTAGTAHLHDSHQAAWGKKEEEGKGSPVMKILRCSNFKMFRNFQLSYLILFIVMSIDVLVNWF